ncbi:hypothetical protein FGE12_00505 [Aggregicoccus sp. 17bor-14]|uniref:hypothetical protein n=1 Tax=Myxococcaceae TaxID=31 RepID=UPI00129C330D|nr:MULTISPECIES: hypothetical protein [Myxococcaceae]MBF5040853.1 hypothetical protein [Simulacricoccus sp. 17bor-14]MRI86642.1 hypothetical protein [Aggregicoccus sp. 17bor-14]
MRPALLVVAALLCSSAVLAEKPKAKAKKPPMSVPSLGLTGLGALPKGEELSASRSAPEPAGPQVRAVDERFEVLGVQHMKGARQTGALSEVALTGSPLRTEPFSTRVKVRSSARRTAPIDVVVLDARGDTAMSASGTLSFTGVQGEVSEYTVDWDPTECRGPGTYSVLVRVAGQPLGTWPLKVVARAP